MVRKKGQFFILGAVIILSLFAYELFITEIPAYDTVLFDNVMNEYANALNFGLIENKSVSYIEDFSLFLKQQLGIKTNTLWVVSEPFGDNIKISIGNFWDKNLRVMLDVNGQDREIFIPTSSVNTTIYYNVPDIINLKVEWDSHEKVFHWIKDKAHLYAISRFEIGKNVIVKEVNR